MSLRPDPSSVKCNTSISLESTRLVSAPKYLSATPSIREVLAALDSDCHFRFKVDPLPNDPVRWLTEFVSAFSRPLFTRNEQVVVGRIRPVVGRDPHSFQGSQEFDLHTDLTWMSDEETPRYATLLCLKADQGGGGESLFVRLDDILAEMSDLETKELQETQMKWYSHRDAAHSSSRQASVLSKARDGDGARVRFRRDLMDIPFSLTTTIDRFYRIANERRESFIL